MYTAISMVIGQIKWIVTERVLGLDGRVGHQGLGLALVVDGGDAEEVLLALLKTRDVKLGWVHFTGYFADLCNDCQFKRGTNVVARWLRLYVSVGTDHKLQQ